MLVLPLYCNYSESSEASETLDALQEMKILQNSSSRLRASQNADSKAQKHLWEENTQLAHHTDLTSYISSYAYHKRADARRR